MAGLCLRHRRRPARHAEIWDERLARFLRRRSALAQTLRLFGAGRADAERRSGRMKFTLSWLKPHLNTDADLPTVLKGLTTLGLEVEGVENPAEKDAKRGGEGKWGAVRVDRGGGQ